MQVELTENELKTLDAALESLNRTGISRQDSAVILTLSQKLRTKPDEKIDSEE